MRLIGFMIIAVFLSFGAQQVSMSLDAHEAMCHGPDCASMASEAANDVACALHCLSTAVPFQTSSPEIPLASSLFLVIALATVYVLRFKDDLVPHCAGSPHSKFLHKLRLATVVIRS